MGFCWLPTLAHGTRIKKPQAIRLWLFCLMAYFTYLASTKANSVQKLVGVAVVGIPVVMVMVMPIVFVIEG